MAASYYQKMTEIYGCLQDEESKALFEARIGYLLDQDQESYMDIVFGLYQDWYPSKELENKVSLLNPSGIIIFGCGCGGRRIQKMLSFWGIEVAFFCDNHRYGETVGGKDVLSIDRVIKEYKDYLVIIGSYEYADDMYHELVEKGFATANILLSENRLLMWARGNQYFDVFPPHKDEIFVDAGSFDGQTLVDFCKWANHGYKKIYAFERIKEMCEVIQQKEIPRIEICNNAVWDKEEKLFFKLEDTSSHINPKENESGMCIQGVDIDSVVGDDNVTFIKMDVEGSELKALEGAKNTIIRKHPRLAICIYHKAMDVIEIPSYILSLVPEYKFYIRHYNSHMWETVLYAEV